MGNIGAVCEGGSNMGVVLDNLGAVCECIWGGGGANEYTWCTYVSYPDTQGWTHSIGHWTDTLLLKIQ